MDPISSSAPSPLRRRALPSLLIALCLWSGAPLGVAAGAPQSPGPLPIDVVLALPGYNGRSPVNVSPDGEWIAHTVASADRVPRGDSYAYADTGFPFAEGNARMEATLSDTQSDEVIRLGDDDSSSWAAAWSPDGRRVAFYSDSGGEAGLWIWERATRRAHRVGDMIVRPFFGFEAPRWRADGERLLVKLLPEGRTMAEANALLPAANAEPEPAAPDSDGVRVTVRRSSAARPEATEAEDGPGEAPAGRLAQRVRGMASDLAVVDPTTGQVERIVHDTSVRMYAFSPDGSQVAYSGESRFLPDSQQALYQLRLHDLASGADTLLAEDVPLRYGIEWSWSPEGRRLAYTRSGQTAEGDYVVVEIPDGTSHRLDNEAPNLAPGEGEVPPIWSPDGDRLYGVGEGGLWSIDPDSGAAREAVRIAGWQIRNLVTPDYASPVAWSLDGGETLWVIARSEDGAYGIHAVRPDSGEAALRHSETRSWSNLFNLAASSAGSEIFYVARGQHLPGEIHSLDVDSGAVSQVSRINRELARYPLGEARRIDFTSVRGEELQAALLLPPDHRPGDRLPLVVWVYGGATGSDTVDSFGLWGSMAAFNMHLLATRGYAVLHPDVPLRSGRTIEDLVGAVMPAVDAAIEQGWADPDRMAVMGQSFGALNTLALLTRTDRFDAAVITAAVQHPDLFADYLRDGNTGYYEQGQGDMGGTPWEVPDHYRDNSPLFDFDRITTPLLIGQGEQDGDLEPTEAIFNAFERLGLSVEYRVYGGESHVIAGRDNVRDFWERRLAFLAEHLDLEIADDGSVRERP